MRLRLLIILLLATLSLKGQVHTDFTGNEKIKTVQLYREGWDLSYPVIKLGSDEQLLLQFDLLGNQPETYYYTFVHCDKDWNDSGAFPNDYLDGFDENPVEDYRSSFNTTVGYYHYRLSFPNERVRLKISGNYVILVYQPGKKDNPEIVRRFIITEDAAKIDINAHRPQMTKNNNTHQQVDFNVNFGSLKINDPYRDIYASVLQNGRWDNAKNNLSPDIYGSNELKYSSLSEKNIFPGGNEYRYFDIKSIRYQSEYVRRIDFAYPNYNVFLQPSESRLYKPYFYWKDFNGKYIIAFQEGQNPEIDADYVYVYFTLSADQEISDAKVYVSGALNNWQFDKNNLMTYNPASKQYECTMLLKQGWYNYEYVVVPGKKKNEVPSDFFEGSHYETENDYIVIIYYRNPRERYDRVIGTAIKNTLNNLSD
jgi:hypothetical protein